MRNIHDQIIMIFRYNRIVLHISVSSIVIFFNIFQFYFVLLEDYNFSNILRARVPENTLNRLAPWREQRRQSVETNFRGVTRSSPSVSY